MVGICLFQAMQNLHFIVQQNSDACCDVVSSPQTVLLHTIQYD